MRIQKSFLVMLFALSATVTSFCNAQNATTSDQKPPEQKPAEQKAPDPAPTPLSTPSITGPLAQLPPAVFEAGPFGKIAVNGIVNAYGRWQSDPVSGDSSGQATLSNGQIFLQKPDGKFQYFIEAGVYTIPSLGVPFLSAEKTLTDFFGPVPVGFAKWQAAKNTSFQIGALPTLIGAEYTFTFENMNIERGLLWNQEPAVSKGIQVNQTMGKFTASFSWNDGYYSNRYNWLSGSLAYTKGPHALSFVAGGTLGQTGYQTLATPVENNGSIYNVIYTYTKGPWIIQPYFQYNTVPTNPSAGIVKGASATGGAVLASYAFKHGFSLPARWEYISSSGSVAENSTNLIFGPGSSGTSITVTPTLQHGGFFVRGDLSWVHAGNYSPGTAFGSNGTNADQVRAVGEVGFIFGNNIVEKAQ
jgi:Putative beta-barrel porin-2, OmpL-like. bbp2